MSDGRAPDGIVTTLRRDSSTRRSGETADILDYMAQARRKARNNPESDPLVVEIVDALITLGGQAHRDRVADAVASARAGAPTRATPALTAHLSAAFDDRLLFDRSVVGRPVLFALPHGAGSLRWALAREARAFLWRSRRSRGPSC